jgi:hypothetical protein
MTAAFARPRIVSLLAASALALTATLISTQSARADLADVWTTYPSMSACQGGLVNLNDFCYGLQDGQAIGLVDASLAVDELDQSLGIYYDDDNVVPAPEGPSNPVVQVWNNTSDITFIAGGASAYDDAADGDPIYFIPAHADDTGPAIDANGLQTLCNSYCSSTIDYDYAAIILASATSPGSNAQADAGQY